MVRKLKDIEIEEVSLVDKAANKKKFLFYKQEDKLTKKLKKNVNIVIESDGTVGGTKIVVNKEGIEKLSSFNFSFWSDSSATSPVSCSYTKFVEDQDGFSRSETFYLSKGDSKMNVDIKKQLEDYFGKDSEIDFEKVETDEVVIKALETVNEYKEDFPDDLKKAVGIIAVAKQNGITKKEKEEVKEEIEKSGAKFSKDTLKKITDALNTLKSILPELKEETEKSKEVEKADTIKTVEELQKKITELEKKKEAEVIAEKENESKTKLDKALETLIKRVETVEKTTGIKKSVEGQDGTNDNTDGEKLWPSFSN